MLKGGKKLSSTQTLEFIGFDIAYTKKEKKKKKKELYQMRKGHSNLGY